MNTPGISVSVKALILSDLRTRRPDYVWLSIFAALLFVLTAGIWHPTTDSGLYLNQAHNLIHEMSFSVDESSNWYASPGYSLLISPFFLMDELPLTALTLFQAFLTTLYMVGVFVWASRFSRQSAALITGAATLHACVWLYCYPTISEAAFMATMMWAVVCLTFYGDHRETRLGKQVLCIAICLMSYSTFIRPAGLMIALGGAAHLWVTGRQSGQSPWRMIRMILLWLIPPTLVLILFLAHETVASWGNPASRTYFDAMIPTTSHSSAQMILTGIHKRISDIGRLLVPGMFKTYSTNESWLHVTMIFYIPIFIGIMFAWFKQIRTKSDMLLWGLIPYVMLHVVYSKYDDGARFLTPMLPVLMLLIWWFFGLYKSLQHWLILALFVAHAGVMIGLAIHEQPKLVAIENQWQTAAKCAQFIKDDPGIAISLGDVNGLELQINVLANNNVYRKRKLKELALYNPRWIIRRQSDTPIPQYSIVWSDDQFQLLKPVGKSKTKPAE